MRVYCDVKTCANRLDGHCINAMKHGEYAIRIDENGRCEDYVPVPAEEDKGKEESDE